MKQKRTSLGAEASFNWNEIDDDELTFDSDLKKIEALERVSKESLMACFEEIFFDNPRRVNLKVHSHAHRDDTETRQSSQVLNKAFYKRSDLFGEGELSE